LGQSILVVLLGLIVLVLAALGFTMMGLFSTQANAAPPSLEGRVANRALVASMQRHAPRVTNPLTPSDQNLIDGLNIYYENCALCHVSLDRKPAALAKNLYPPAPNLISVPPDDTEGQIFLHTRARLHNTTMPDRTS